MKIVAQNRKAFHDYNMEESFEAGIALKGTEVKAIREGKLNLKDSYVLIKNGEALFLNCHISHYSHGNLLNHDPLRTRKLLLNQREIKKMMGRSRERGYAIIPLKVYLKGPYIKVEIGLARGKKLFEKRERTKEREAQREIERALRH